MLRRIVLASPNLDPATSAFRKFLAETLVDRDIGAQETCHMIQKLPLTLCSRSFFPLNVSQQIYMRLPENNTTAPPSPHFIDTYIHRPSPLESTSLIEIARSWSYDPRRKTNKWKQRPQQAILRIIPRYSSIPSTTNSSYADFCRVELMLYKPFRHIASDIGNSAEEFIRNWQAFRPFYKLWHQHRTLYDINPPANDNTTQEFHPPETMDLNEWELLSQLYPTDELLINDIQMLGLRGLDDSHNWNDTTIPLHLQEIGA